jgi:predicted GIY-YIG superfamily endonuclease
MAIGPRVSFRPKGEIFSLRMARQPMPEEKRYYVYLLTNWNNKVMYVGVTNDLKRRLYEHKIGWSKDSRTNTTFTNLCISKKRMTSTQL